MSKNRTDGRRWQRLATLYRRPRIIALLFLGFSSGLPLALTMGTLAVWLAEDGLSRATIGLFAAVGTPYALKFLWSPVIDRMPLPVLSRLMGRRRGWLIAAQFALMAAIVALGFSDPAKDAAAAAGLAALMVAFWSATQDIVIDAYRVEILDLEEQAAGAAMLVFGYRLGMLVSGAGALYLADVVAWPVVYAVMASLIMIGVVTVLLAPEPERFEGQAHDENVSVWQRARAWLTHAVVMPFADFTTRRGWIIILLFVVLYKFGDSLAGVMTNPFLISVGFSKAEIASVAKIFGFTATLGGLALGGMLMAAQGLYRSLMICGILQILSLLLFAGQVVAGHDVAVLALTIGFENLASGMGTAVFVAYLSSLCHRDFTATQYALLSSLTAVARAWLSSGAGFLAGWLDWLGFFLISAAAAVPGLILLVWLHRRTTKPGRAAAPEFL